jgi:hypothetical protein
VGLCIIHREYFVSSSMDPIIGGGYPYCCDRIFNNTPFFTNEGTCYTTKEDIVESYASSMSSIKIWLNISEEASPGICPLFSSRSRNYISPSSPPPPPPSTSRSTPFTILITQNFQLTHNFQNYTCFS